MLDIVHDMREVWERAVDSDHPGPESAKHGARDQNREMQEFPIGNTPSVQVKETMDLWEIRIRITGGQAIIHDGKRDFVLRSPKMHCWASVGPV